MTGTTSTPQSTVIGSTTTGETHSSSHVDATRRTISPYDLTSGDNPGILISRTLLRGVNYDTWATNQRCALVARKKFGFANGSIAQPDKDSEDYED